MPQCNEPIHLRLKMLFTYLLVISLASILPSMAVAANSSTESSSGINILLMGVDKASSDVFDEGVRPDSLMVLNLDRATGSCRILGIPRDTRVDIPSTGNTKINHALSIGGVPLQVEMIENLLDVEIDHYGMVAYQGLIGVVDSVNGITVNNPYAFELEGTYFKAGEIHLNGTEALTYSRYRYGPDGDFGRIARQQLVIRALLQEFGNANPIMVIPQLVSAIDGYFKTDLTLPVLISLASQFQNTCTTDTLETRTLTGDNAMFHDPLLNLDLWYVVIDQETIVRDVQWLLTGEE